MGNYLFAPVAADRLHGAFEVVESAADDRRELTAEEAMRLASVVNGLVNTTGLALWFNPLVDGKGLRAYGEPVKLDGHTVVYTPRQEGAIFPAPNHRQLDSDQYLAA